MLVLWISSFIRKGKNNLGDAWRVELKKADTSGSLFSSYKTSHTDSKVAVSKEFLIRLKLHEEPAYRIAQQAGVNPSTLSRLINGADSVRPWDSRIIAVGQVLGLSSDECFRRE